MSSILVDTGPLVALADKRDRAHLDCKSFLENYRGRLVTTWAVLTEFSHADRPMDLADASLVVAAMSTGIHTVWTLDRSDFETYRLPGRKRFHLSAMTK